MDDSSTHTPANVVIGTIATRARVAFDAHGWS